MSSAVTLVIRTAAALSACLAFAASSDVAFARGRDHGGGDMMIRDHRAPPVVRDHRSPVIVRDHRDPVIVVRDHRPPVIVRDHRDPVVVVRDHRPPVIVRDHRGSSGGVVVTATGGRRGRSSCIRSVFGGPCFGW